LNEVGEGMTSLPEEMHDNEFIREAAELCERGAYTTEELARYDGFLDAVRTENTLMEGARIEGRIEGRAEGEAIGLEKGEAIGRTAEKENVVINSLKAGLPVETISSITGLAADRIIEILKRHGLL